MDDGRVRGVAVGEPLGLRLGRGARLSAIVTGLDKKQQGTTLLVPPAPRQVVDRVAAEVIGTTTPLEAVLTSHGPAAIRRRWIRALALPLLLLVGIGALIVFDDASAWWLLLPLLGVAVGAGLAVDRARSLGHALVDGWLVVRSGSLVRRRELLQTDGVIGWNLRSTYFQRRVGLTTLVATTAGGSQSYAALDVPEARAIEVARLAQPQLIEQFLG